MWSQLFGDLVKWLKAFWFECRLKARLTMIEWQNKAESDLEREKRFEPVYQEKPIDEQLQTGESQELGGEMRLVAKWVVEEEEKLERFKKTAWSIASDRAIETDGDVLKIYNEIMDKQGLSNNKV